MGLENVTPISIDQMLRALATRGQEHVVDPEVRPDGLIKQDVPELLGALLGLVETETTTVVDPMEGPPRSFHGLQQGWQHTSADRVIHRAVLTNRLRRTPAGARRGDGVDQDDDGLTASAASGPRPGVADLIGRPVAGVATGAAARADSRPRARRPR
ncbi:hypothetical protein [Streptomyces sp. NPDC004788]